MKNSPPFLSIFCGLGLSALCLSLGSCLFDSTSKDTGKTFLSSQNIQFPAPLDSIEFSYTTDSLWSDTLNHWAFAKNMGFSFLGQIDSTQSLTQLAFSIPLDTQTSSDLQRKADSITLTLLPYTPSEPTLSHYNALSSDLTGLKVRLEIAVLSQDSKSFSEEAAKKVFKPLFEPLSGLPYPKLDLVSAFSKDSQIIYSSSSDTLSLPQAFQNPLKPQQIKLPLLNLSKNLGKHPTQSHLILIRIQPLSWPTSHALFLKDSSTLTFKSTGSTKPHTYKLATYNISASNKSKALSHSILSNPYLFKPGILLSPFHQNIWFRINKHSFNSTLETLGLKQDPKSTGYNLKYFISKAYIYCPLDSSQTQIYGNTALPISLRSTLDTSITKDSSAHQLTVKIANTDSSLVLPSKSEAKGNTLYLSYYKKDSSWFLLTQVKSSNQIDTVQVWPGLNQRLSHLPSLDLYISPDSNSIALNISFRSTDQSLTSTQLLIKGNTQLRLDATHYLQRLFNYNSNDYKHNFEIQLSKYNAPFKNAFVNEKGYLDLPAFAKVPLSLNNKGQLTLKFKVYYLSLP